MPNGKKKIIPSRCDTTTNTNEWDKIVMEDLDLITVIDNKYKTGVTISKCCHAFHYDCLQRYQFAEM